MITISVSQYEIEQLPKWQAYEDKIVRLVEQAKENQSQLLLMSEYAGLELCSWLNSSLEEQLNYIQTILHQYKQLFSSLAQQEQIYIQPGTIPVKEKDGYYRNRAFFFTPDGQIDYQDKIYLAPFEQKIALRPGRELRIFETSLGKLGINISYDSEFPLLTKRLAAAGVNLVLVPSCTEKISGLTRVKISCRARAIENQCYVAQSCLIGKVSWSKFIDINIGQSAIYCPADIGFPEDGILAQAQLNAPMLIHANLSWDTLKHVRERGEMLNYRDMQKDINPELKVDTIKMV